MILNSTESTVSNPCSLQHNCNLELDSFASNSFRICPKRRYANVYFITLHVRRCVRIYAAPHPSSEKMLYVIEIHSFGAPSCDALCKTFLFDRSWT